jgi:ADP-ribose pyrophosphatase
MDEGRTVIGFDVVEDATLGAGGFMHLRKMRLKVVRADGTRSREASYDFVERPRGLDAVVVALYRRSPRPSGASDGVEVLIRDQLRVPVSFGRPEAPPALAGRPHPAVFVSELVAGLIEPGEEGEAAIRGRAAAEVYEETGLSVTAEEIVSLGGPLYATGGMCAERVYFTACEVKNRVGAVHPPGDGSPFEEGARIRWLPLGDAIAACRRGEIADQKSEVALARLKDRLG